MSKPIYRLSHNDSWSFYSVFVKDSQTTWEREIAKFSYVKFSNKGDTTQKQAEDYASDFIEMLEKKKKKQ